MLAAALAQGDDVLNALAAWRRHTAGVPLDTSSLRLLPLLEHNLRAHGIHDPAMDDWQAVGMQTWLDNHRLLQEAAPILAAFAEAGIETRVLKGAALVVLVYGDAALRPMTDVDILVPIAQAREAIAVLTRAGWTPEFAPAEDVIAYQHAVGFSNDRGGRCDLHWLLLADGRQAAGDDAYWRRSIPCDLGGLSAAALCPADQLLHVLVHGALWNHTPTARWVADAAWLVRTFDTAIDWTMLAERITERGLASPVQSTLGYLHTLVGGLIPADAFATIQRVRAPLFEQFVHYCRSHPRKAVRAVGRAQYWFRRWQASPAPLSARASEFRRYVRTVPQ